MSFAQQDEGRRRERREEGARANLERASVSSRVRMGERDKG